MGTQAIISIRKNGNMEMKIIAGINGANASAVAKAIRKLGEVPTLNKAYDIAVENEFGVEESLVVMTALDHLFKDGDLSDELSDRYYKTFDNPNFNPRWEQGFADYVEIVDL